MLYEVITLASSVFAYWQNVNKAHNLYTAALGSLDFSAPYYLLRFPEANDAQYGSIAFERAVNHYKQVNSVITSYSIHYTKLYDALMLPTAIN